ncbi:MAG: protein kinase [Lentisphaerae bacterium]|nr:protein kinase [Lentisphaerota bacterium]
MTAQIPDNDRSGEAPPVLEGYRVLSKLGHGATSSIWKAEQVSLNRLVVIKTLLERLAHTPEDMALFKAEALVTANLKHPHIVQVYDFGQSKKSQCYYFVMEYISGYSVGDWVRRSGRIPESDALIIAQSVAAALQYAWDLSKIVHRDIKPDNIMVDGDGSIKVADLGVAHAVKTIAPRPGEKGEKLAIAGTPNYMAPEQIRGSATIDCRADIYALGASLYHIVTGTLPFGDSPPEIVMQRQLQEPLEYPQKVNPDLSTGITRLIVKMTAKEPAARFLSWNEVLAEVIRLERLLRHHAAAASQPAPVAPAGQAAARPPAADSKKDHTRAEAGRICLSCGKPVQAQARYCAFCGKSLAAPAAEPGEDQRRLTIRLKPIRTTRPASAPSGATPPDQVFVYSPRQRTAWGGSLRAVISLGLLAFLGYGAYQKVKYDRNVFIPLKGAIVRAGQSLLERARVYVKPETSSTKPATALPGPEETPAPAESPEAQPGAAPEVESAAEPAPATEPAATETPEAQAQPSAAPGAPETPQPEATTKPAEAEQSATATKLPEVPVYERILEKCKRQQPQAGNSIAIRFKDGRAPVEGVLQEKTSGGVMIKVSAGVIEYPFHLMAEETRLLYFPEERARRLQRQQQMQKSE